MVGLPPAPRPRVSFEPICKRFLAADSSSAWASVLQDQNSTPFKPAVIMRLTAFEPAPPKPMTLMLALASGLGDLSVFSVRSATTAKPLLREGHKLNRWVVILASLR